MISLALLCGAVIGLGIYALVRVWLRPKPGVAALVYRIDSGTKSMLTQTVTPLEMEQAPSRLDSFTSRIGDRLEVLAPMQGG